MSTPCALLEELHTSTAVFTATVTSQPLVPSRVSRKAKSLVAQSLEAPGVFCTMPFLPLPIPEPFSVSATSIVEAYHIGGGTVEKLPQTVTRVLREVLFKATVRRGCQRVRSSLAFWRISWS